jgi:hypothetical protein
MCERLIHDAARAGAQALLDMVAPALLPDERKDFREEAYIVCKAMIEAYQIQVNREAPRLCPSRN